MSGQWVRSRGLSWLDADGKKILLARSLRTFAYGYLAVILALYLEQLGLHPVQVGIVLTAAIAGSAGMTIGWSLLADRYGRRRTVTTMSVWRSVTATRPGRSRLAGGGCPSSARACGPLTAAAR